MADTVGIRDRDGANVDIAADDLGGILKIQRVKATFGVDGSATDVSTGNPLPVVPSGNVAHDAVDNGNPIKTGARAVTALPAAVAAGDRADSVSDKHGRQLVAGAPVDQRLDGTRTLTDTTAATVIAAAASTRIVVTSVLVTNAHATVSTKVEISDGTTIRFRGVAVPAGGGFSHHDDQGLFIAPSGAAITARCATTGADVDVNIAGYRIPG